MKCQKRLQIEPKKQIVMSEGVSKGGLKGGVPRCVKKGMRNRMSTGITHVIAYGMPNVLPSGMSNRMLNAMRYGIPDWMPNAKLYRMLNKCKKNKSLMKC